MPKKLIIGGFDIESTGLLSPDHRIIEACVQQYEVDPANPSAAFLVNEKTWRIHPKRSIDAKAYAVHNISLDDLAGCPEWSEVAADICAWLDACDIVVAHNGIEFDFPFLIQECERVGQPLPDFYPFDTMQDGRWATPFGKVPNLGELCFASGVPYNAAEAHAADYDVRKMMASFFFGWAQGFYQIPASEPVAA